MSELFVGITSFNCLPYLVHNIESMQKNRGAVRVHVLIIDNNSTDGTKNWLADHGPRGFLALGGIGFETSYISLSFNAYASYGCKTAIEFFLERTRCSHFLHLDPDCEISTPVAFSMALDQLNSSSNLAAIGERRYALRFEHPKSRSLKKFDGFIIHGEWSRDLLRKAGSSKSYSSDELIDLLTEKHPIEDYRVYRELCGNVMLFKRDIIELIGNVDSDRFQMWRWDSEYSMRPLLFGYDIQEATVVQGKQIVHFGGRSRLRVSNPGRYLAEIKDHTGLSSDDVSFLDLYYGKATPESLGLSPEKAMEIIKARI